VLSKGVTAEDAFRQFAWRHPDAAVATDARDTNLASLKQSEKATNKLAVERRQLWFQM
jgi:hypothetical protein